MGIESIGFLILGALGGLLGALFGVGGGIVLVPSLVLYFSVPIGEAICASIFSVVVSSVVVSIGKLRCRQVPIRFAAAMELFTLPSSIAGAYLTLALDTSLLTKLFAVAVVLIAIILLRDSCNLAEGEGRVLSPNRESQERQYFGDSYLDETTGEFLTYQVRNIPLVAALMIISGISSGMLGIGGGIINIPVFRMAGKIPFKLAAATSAFMIGVSASGAALVYFLNGDFDPITSAWLMLGVPIGAKIGQMISTRSRPVVLQRLFAVVLVLLGIRLWTK